MAKYYLNKTNKVHCRILDENCIADTYTIKFDNGVIRNVSKSKVTDLDKLDEGILDRLKEVGSNLLDNLVKAGRYLLCKFKGGISNSLINTMITAEERPNIEFIPGETFVKVCDEAGVEATVTEDDTVYDEDEEFLDDANEIWMARIQQYKEENGELDESVKTYKVSSYASRVLSRLNEAEEIKMEMSEEGFDNVSVQELQKMIIAQYNQFVNKGAGKKGAEVPIPYCVWGAPGIGKTQVIKALIKNFQAAGFDANMISVNAMTMRKDDFTLPGARTVTKKVKLANGKEVDFDVQEAVELAKNWLPMYDPSQATEEVTEDMLDDLMNGGDGSGNGKGGFIFIDELSRVSPDVMDVLMQFVQSRTMGVQRLGSKWMIVAAANRLSDMGERGDRVMWEAAYTGRFSHVNLVPTFEDWLKWAELKRKDGKPNIHPTIVQFLKEHPNFWYSSVTANDSGDEIVDTMFSQARSWENVTKEWYEAEDANDAYNREGDEDDEESAFMKMAYGSAGIKGGAKRDLNPNEIGRMVRHHAGNAAGKAFAAWSGFDARYTDAMAKEVWTKGDKAPMNFQASAATMEKAMQKILANHPQYTGSKAAKIDITPKQMLNVIKWMVALADKIDGGTGDTKTQVLQAGYATLVTLIRNAPFRINLADTSSDAFDKYEEAISLYNDEVTAAKDEAEKYYENN